jgi:hypothetical protein
MKSSTRITLPPRTVMRNDHENALRTPLAEETG